MKGKRIALIALSLLTLFALTPVASAFSDIKGKKGERHIVQLKDRGIIKGDSNGKGSFRPQEKLTYAQAAVLLDDEFLDVLFCLTELLLLFLNKLDWLLLPLSKERFPDLYPFALATFEPS